MIFCSPPDYGRCSIGKTVYGLAAGPRELDDPEAAASEYPLMAETSSSP